MQADSLAACLPLSLSLFWRRLLHILWAGRLRAWDFPTPHSKPLILCFWGNIKHRGIERQLLLWSSTFNLMAWLRPPPPPPPSPTPSSLCLALSRSLSLLLFLTRSMRCTHQLTKTHSCRQGYFILFFSVYEPRHRGTCLASNKTSAHPKPLRRWTDRCCDGRRRLVLQQVASRHRWSGVKRAS